MIRSTFLLLSILMISSSCNNVDDRSIRESDVSKEANYSGIETCDEGRELAKKELSEGNLRYIFGGWGGRQEFASNLESMYNVEVIRLEGTIGIPITCYNQIMEKEIKKRFGEDAFTKAMEGQN